MDDVPRDGKPLGQGELLTWTLIVGLLRGQELCNYLPGQGLPKHHPFSEKVWIHAREHQTMIKGLANDDQD